MADIRIDIKGDASGAQGAMKDMGRTIGTSAAQWQELGAIVKKAGEQVLKFAVDSVKAYADSERVQRQLVRVSGEYADALSGQAEALSRINAVDDDVIKQSQILLTQWGGVGAATSKVTQAVLDYSAATGTDAVSATKDLIRNVESGGAGLAKMGVHFKATGDKGKDLGSAIAALGKKFGGAGASDAQSLAGQMKLAEMAFGDVKKAFGGLIGSIEAKYGVLEKVAGAMRGIAAAIGRAEGATGLLDVLSPGGLAAAATAGIAQNYSGGTSDAGLPAVSTVKGATNKALQSAEQGKSQDEFNDESIERTKKFYADLESIEEYARRKDEEAYAAELEMSAKSVEASIKEANERVKVRQEMLRQIEKENAEHAEKMAKQEKAAEDRAAKEQAEAAKKKADQSKAVGDQIGAAFVNGLTTQLEKLASGGEFDAAMFVGDILATVFSVAATAIAAAYGMPALGAAIGNLGSMGIRAGFGEVSKSNKRASMPQKYHDGGWVGGAPSGDGGWVNPNEQFALLRRNERVLTPEETQRMGGARNVDRMAAGGSSAITVNVNAINARSVAESVETDFGLGLRRALRAGRGNVPQMAGTR